MQAKKQLEALNESFKRIAESSNKEKILSEWIDELIEDGTLIETDDATTAIYYFDGQLYTVEYDSGIRGTDHNTLVGDGLTWNDILNLGTVIVPERGIYISDTDVPELDDDLERMSDVDEHLNEDSDFQIDVNRVFPATAILTFDPYQIKVKDALHELQFGKLAKIIKSKFNDQLNINYEITGSETIEAKIDVDKNITNTELTNICKNLSRGKALNAVNLNDMGQGFHVLVDTYFRRNFDFQVW